MQSPVAALQCWLAEKPDDVLVESWQQGKARFWTVEQIYARAIALARRLIHSGVNQDSVIGLHLQLEPDLVTAFYACWLAGCTPTVFNLAWDQQTRNGIISRLQIGLVLCTALPPADLPSNVETLVIDQEQSAVEGFQQRPEPFYALINQSSGTTGLPKVSLLSRSCVKLTKSRVSLSEWRCMQNSARN